MLPSKTQQKKIPYQNAPSVTLGRLAIDKSVQGQGWGEMLVAHAMRVVWERLKPLVSTDCLLKPLMRRLKHSIFVWGLYSSWMKIVTYCFIRPNRLNSSLLTMSHKETGQRQAAARSIATLLLFEVPVALINQPRQFAHERRILQAAAELFLA